VAFAACSTTEGDTACASGATRSCHAVLQSASGQGVLSCISGTQTCGGGTWGACNPDGTITSTTGFSGSFDSSGMLRTEGLPQPCVDDPCDPTCQYFPSPDGGLGLDATVGATYSTGGVPLNALPPGWSKVNKQPCSTSSDCQFDSHCVSGTCALYNTGEKNSCVGVDFTAPSACTSSGNDLFPICNRGSKDATSGTVTVGFDMNPPPGSACAPVGGGYPSKGSCVVDLAKTPIAAGSCIDIDPVNKINVKSCAGVNVSGNRDFFVNYDNKFSECNACNNEGMKKSGTTCLTSTVSGYAPVTYTATYVASCTSPKVPQWRALAWAATTPSSGGSSSDVKFQGQLGSVGADGGATSLGTLTTLGDTPAGADPATCGLFGPAPCPKDLTAEFGGNTLAQKPALKLTITLSPSTDTLVAPTLSSWQITYSCEDAQ
jgi:hypothetical protein